MTVSGSYFCACVTRKFSRKLLPLPVAPEHQRVPDVLDVQVEGVRASDVASRRRRAPRAEMRARRRRRGRA